MKKITFEPEFSWSVAKGSTNELSSEAPTREAATIITGSQHHQKKTLFQQAATVGRGSLSWLAATLPALSLEELLSPEATTHPGTIGGKATGARLPDMAFSSQV